jgi:uncharacterized protein with HEPN domain
LIRTTQERLTDIHDAARDLLDFVGTMQSDAFHALPATDRMAHRAMKNALVEIGEAIKALPPEIALRYPLVDWRGFAGLRHRRSRPTLHPFRANCRSTSVEYHEDPTGRIPSLKSYFG